jgi:hypothetical protein
MRWIISEAKAFTCSSFALLARQEAPRMPVATGTFHGFNLLALTLFLFFPFYGNPS